MDLVDIKMLVDRKVWCIEDGSTRLKQVKVNDIITVFVDNASILIDAKQAKTIEAETIEVNTEKD